MALSLKRKAVSDMDDSGGEEDVTIKVEDDIGDADIEGRERVPKRIEAPVPKVKRTWPVYPLLKHPLTSSADDV